MGQTNVPTWRHLGFSSYEVYEKYLKYLETQESNVIPIWKRQGFESYKKYHEYMSQPIWKRQGFESYEKYERHVAKERIAKRKGFESYSAYKEHLTKIMTDVSKKKKFCESIQDITFNVKDPESIFNDEKFVGKITGCRILTKRS